MLGVHKVQGGQGAQLCHADNTKDYGLDNVYQGFSLIPEELLNELEQQDCPKAGERSAADATRHSECIADPLWLFRHILSGFLLRALERLAT